MWPFLFREVSELQGERGKLRGERVKLRGKRCEGAAILHRVLEPRTSLMTRDKRAATRRRETCFARLIAEG